MHVHKMSAQCPRVEILFWSLSSHSRKFHSYGDVTIAGEGLQILTNARFSWPLSSEDSLACHTYCDTGHPFIMVMNNHSDVFVCYFGVCCTYFSSSSARTILPMSSNLTTEAYSIFSYGKNHTLFSKEYINTILTKH